LQGEQTPQDEEINILAHPGLITEKDGEKLFRALKG